MGEILTAHTYQLQEDYSTVDHHSHNFIQDIRSGQIVCNICGFVRETNIFVMDWGSPHISREPPKLPSKNPAHLINQNLKRALKLNRNKTWEDRKLNIGITEIRRLTALFGLGDFIISRSIYLFQKAIKTANFKVHNVILTAQVCFFYAAKKIPIRLH